MDITYNLSGSVGPSHYISGPAFGEFDDFNHLDGMARTNVDMIVKTEMPTLPNLPPEIQERIMKSAAKFGLIPYRKITR